MAKALGSVQSITDGGSYPLSGVRILQPDAKLPGLANLSDYDRWEDKKRNRGAQRRIGNLGGLDWNGEAWEDLLKKTTKEAEGFLDSLAKSHIENFWNRYGLGFKYNIEHKGENTFEALAYWNKTDYAMRQVSFTDTKTTEKQYQLHSGRVTRVDNLKIKVRGERLYDWRYQDRIAPKIELLINILDGVDEVPEHQTHIQTRLQTVSAWFYDGCLEDGVWPGDEVVVVRGKSGGPRWNNGHIYCPDADTKARRLRGRKSGGQYIGGFDRWASKGIKHLHSRIYQDRRTRS